MQRCLARTIVGSLIIGAAMATLGCGGDGSEVDKFVGVWEYDLNGGSVACNDGSPPSDLSGQLIHQFRQFRLGIGSDLVDLSASDTFQTFPCNYRYRVAAGKATIEPGQSCDIVDFSVPTLDKIGEEKPTTGTFSLRGKGDELQEEWVATATSTDGLNSCTTTINNTHLVKVARN